GCSFRADSVGELKDFAGLPWIALQAVTHHRAGFGREPSHQAAIMVYRGQFLTDTPYTQQVGNVRGNIVCNLSDIASWPAFITTSHFCPPFERAGNAELLLGRRY